MSKIFRTVVALAAIVALAVSCAEYETEDNLTAQKRIREAWMRVNKGGVVDVDENGLYVFEKTIGDGAVIGDTSYVMIDYVARDLEGNYTLYTTEEMARKMGTYSATSYYSPEILQFGNYKMYTPVENFIKTLNAGGSANFLLPPEATTYDYPKELKKYYKSYGNDGTEPALTQNYIYDLKVVEVVNDMNKYQIDKLDKFAQEHYPGLDSICEGFYMLKLKTSDNAADTIPSATSVKVRYVAKLLDGFCFDTNIQDTAKVYGLYKTGNTYDALSVTYYPNGYTINSDGSKTYSSDVIKGFAMTVGRMKYSEEAIAFFWSNLAYESASSDSYPAYAPMCFYIHVEDKD